MLRSHCVPKRACAQLTAAPSCSSFIRTGRARPSLHLCCATSSSGLPDAARRSGFALTGGRVTATLRNKGKAWQRNAGFTQHTVRSVVRALGATIRHRVFVPGYSALHCWLTCKHSLRSRSACSLCGVSLKPRSM
eukprot:6191935-Pleurochrysis_carterae.AAC.3